MTLCNLAKADALFEDLQLVLSVLRLVIYSTQQIVVKNLNPPIGVQLLISVCFLLQIRLIDQH